MAPPRFTLKQEHIMIRQTSTLTDVRSDPKAVNPLLYRFEAQLEVTPIGVVPEGLRMANSFEGRVTRGIMEGARVWGIDHLLLRSDGVAVIDAQKTISQGRAHLYEHVRGYGLPPQGLQMPPLETLLDPSFAWPDVLFPVLGSSTFRAAAPELQHLNRAISRIDGWFSFATGGLAIETRLVSHESSVAGPPPSSGFNKGAVGV
jgi:hypothetical protein